MHYEEHKAKIIGNLFEWKKIDQICTDYSPQLAAYVECSNAYIREDGAGRCGYKHQCKRFTGNFRERLKYLDDQLYETINQSRPQLFGPFIPIPAINKALFVGRGKVPKSRDGVLLYST
jgi:hypothetical protein